MGYELQNHHFFLSTFRIISTGLKSLKKGLVKYHTPRAELSKNHELQLFVRFFVKLRLLIQDVNGKFTLHSS